MALEEGDTEHRLGPQDGTLLVNTYREGVAQRIGHDLVIEVERWKAELAVDAKGMIRAVGLHADPQSLVVREGRNGVKSLTDKDRRDIRASIDKKILGATPVEFTSTGVEVRPEGATIRGELTLAGATHPAAFDVAIAEGYLTATLPVTQSRWGIQPYRAFMGALRVRDDVEVVVDVSLPVPRR